MIDDINVAEASLLAFGVLKDNLRKRAKEAEEEEQRRKAEDPTPFYEVLKDEELQTIFIKEFIVESSKLNTWLDKVVQYNNMMEEYIENKSYMFHYKILRKQHYMLSIKRYKQLLKYLEEGRHFDAY